MYVGQKWDRWLGDSTDGNNSCHTIENVPEPTGNEQLTCAG